MNDDRKRVGFTLTELSYLLGIVSLLAVVTFPIYFKVSASDPDTAAKETVQLVRDAICIYSAENEGRFPGADGSSTTFKREVCEQLNSRFPRCPVGYGWKRGVEMVGAVDSSEQVEPLESQKLTGVARPKNAWKYNAQTGEFIINFSGPLVNDPATSYDQL